MTDTDPLAALKDIHAPAPISWWPLAPGWYLLIFFILVLVLLLAVRLYKKHKHALAKKQALVLLAQYQEGYEQERDAPKTCAQISELVRRVALVYYPRVAVASLHGEAWLQFLNATSKGIEFDSVRTLLLDVPFKKEEAMDLLPLFEKVNHWIKQRGVPCSN